MGGSCIFVPLFTWPDWSILILTLLILGQLIYMMLIPNFSQPVMAFFTQFSFSLVICFMIIGIVGFLKKRYWEKFLLALLALDGYCFYNQGIDKNFFLVKRRTKNETKILAVPNCYGMI